MSAGLTILLLIIAITIGLIGGIGAFIYLSKKRGNATTGLEDTISRLSVEALDKNSQRFLAMAKEALSSQKTEIKTDLEGKKDAINNLIDEIRKDIHKNEERLAKSDEDRVKSFSSLKTELENYGKITDGLKASTDKLKSLLSNNQTRGAFGEQIADDLLKMAGFVIGQDYAKNKTQTTQNTRPDFTIFMPDQTKINVDVKFPYASLRKYIESEDVEDKKRYFGDFTKEVREKIKQVSTRDYINPEENTVDFVILFIPNEMIFSYIYEKMPDILEEAMLKKVVLAGPFSFTAILRMVRQAYTNFRYQENLQNIIGLIQKFDNEYQKYSSAVTMLGDRIESASRQYNVVSETRNRQLTNIVDKIKNQNVIDNEEPEIKVLAD
jgi:DNA recombination protein RmuC